MIKPKALNSGAMVIVRKQADRLPIQGKIGAQVDAVVNDLDREAPCQNLETYIRRKSKVVVPAEALLDVNIRARLFGNSHGLGPAPQASELKGRARIVGNPASESKIYYINSNAGISCLEVYDANINKIQNSGEWGGDHGLLRALGRLGFNFVADHALDVDVIRELEDGAAQKRAEASRAARTSSFDF